MTAHPGLVQLVLGSYTEQTPWTGAPDGHGSGVGMATFNTETGELKIQSSLDLPSPSFVEAWGDRVLISVETRATADIHSGRVVGDEIILDGVVNTGVPSACHVAISFDRRVAVVTHYHGHRVALIGLDDAGVVDRVLSVFELPKSTETFERSRQTSLPHFALWLSDERVAIVDCGRDIVSVFRRAGDELELLSAVGLPWGSGPRHMAAHGSRIYVSLQNQAGVAVIAATDESGYDMVEILDSPGQGRATPLVSHIGVHEPTGSVYLANRRDDSISIYGPTASGGLELRTTVFAHGVWPRHFVVTPAQRHLLLANQNSNEVVAYEIEEDGLLRFTGSRIYFPTPTSVTVIEAAK